MAERARFETIERRDLLRAIGAGAIGAAGASLSTGTTSATSRENTYYENPLYGPDFADPTIHRADDGTWWAYASNMSYSQDADERLVPILSSPDLVDWTVEGEAFGSRPGWLYGSVWAPDVHYHDGRWVLFYALWPRDDDDDLVPGIGVATSETPDGPFTDHGEILSNPDHPYPGNTIDPYFVDHEGQPYLFWANFAGVYYVELTADLRDYRSDTFGQIVGSAYEGPALFQRDGYWYFFGATGDCCDGFDSTYEVEVGRAENFLGPYYDRDGTPMLERDEWNAGVTHLGDNERFVGPGHGDVTVDDDGTYWFVYHAYDTEGPENADDYGWPPARQLFIDRIYWTGDGWPVIGGDGTPSATAPVPNLGQHSAPVAEGTYHVVNVHSGTHLGVDGTGDGASVTVGTTDAEFRSEWRVTRLSGGEYVLENLDSGLALEVEGGDTNDGADVQQWPRHGHPTQRWYIVEDGDGTYRLDNACSGKIAEVADASTADGATVQQWADNGGDHQRWRFVSIDDEEGPPAVTDNASTPTDPDGDGRYEDINGNGRTDSSDVVQFFEHIDDDVFQENAEWFDFNGSGSVGVDDVVALFDEL
ncbi:family 43 glycosylhydrolase [Halomontanus rarus]|uniref:family 43 glycosylhydrolase n=1 Tax=Halomontanus rarus TaxID=3034020 RepID=UPI0023E7DE0A|nr:family 43 glycosylhydrolase [Halovivax sp. TS33]